ncbi:MAG: acyltransferase, partial [Planctomycetota bacterium]
ALPPRIADLLSRAYAGGMRRLVRQRYRLLGVGVGRRVGLRKIQVPRNFWDIRLDDEVTLDIGCTLLTTGPRRTTAQGGPRIHIREGVYINRFTMIDATEKIDIGDRTMMGPGCYITDHDHGTALGTPIPKQPLHGAPTIIENDCWIGAGVTVLKNLTIGQGAIVAAGAVVTKSIEPNAIAAGVPAKVIAHRKPAEES